MEKWFHKKAQLITKFMMSQNGQQIIATHILPNISRSNDNQTMTFGQLMEYNIRFFLKNHTRNAVAKLVPDPFTKKTIEHISRSTVLDCVQFVFAVCSSR